MPVISIENLSHRFPGGVIGLDRVNLTIEKGTLVVITGPNGSGKTTLLKHLNGLLLPHRGSVRVDGREVSADPRRARRKVGMIFQDAEYQIVGETVAADVAFGPENLSLSPSVVADRVKAALAAVDLSALGEQRPHELSGGEKRRLCIAGVLALEPEVLLFDEPFASLDYPGTRQVLAEMLRLNQEGRTLVVTTHDLEKIVHHADRLVVMQCGRIVRDGPPAQIIRDVEQFGVRPPCALRWGKEMESWLS